MSKVTKRKHVMNEALWDDYELPKENQTVVKVLKSKGNNLHEEELDSQQLNILNYCLPSFKQNVYFGFVTTPSGEEYLVSMPTKFRKNIWVKRGDYILVEPIVEGDKVKGEIVKIMNKDSIKYYKENNVWPKEFDDNKSDIKTNDDDLFVNTNRNHVTNYSSESDSSDESDSNSDSDENGK